MSDMLCPFGDNTKNGKCSNCGECCANRLPLSDEEVARIKAYIHDNGIGQQKGAPHTCPFRDHENGRCAIYRVRPTICRVYMCNATIDDIKKLRPDLSALNKIVNMRDEFFGG